MAVDTTDTYSGPYTTNGSTTVFPFTFKALTTSELTVVLYDADGDLTTVSPSAYSVSLAGDGGSVTFTTAPATGSSLYILSAPSFEQPIQFADGDKWRAAPVNEANDRAAVRDLHLKNVTDRALAVPLGEAGIVIPSSLNRAGKALSFDEAGNAIAVPSTAVDLTLEMASYRDGALAAQTGAQAAQGVAAGYASQTAGDRGASAASAAAANISAGQALGAQAATTIAAATVGVYPNAAAANVPRGLTQAGVGTITAGSGGTNGTFALAWSGGNFLVNPTGTFTVAGGVLTAVTITGPGLYIGASPTVPTPSFAASSGLTGAAVALTAQFLVASGVGYWVQSSDTKTYNRYYNASGVATADTGVQSIPASPSLTSVIAQLAETVTNVWGVASPVTGGASGGTRWAFLNTTAPYDLLVTSMVVSVTATGAQKLEISYPPAPTNRTQAAPDVVVTPTTTGLQTLVAGTHFTAFTVPAGAQVGQFGNWVGYTNGSSPDAALCGGIDSDTTYGQSAPSNVTFQIQLTGTRGAPIALETRLRNLDSATTYNQTTVTQVGASLLVAGASTSSAGAWTLSTALPVTAPVDQIFIDAKATATMIVRLMRSGSQVGADHTYAITSTGPQVIPVNLVDARAGDKIRVVGVAMGYNSPPVGDDAATDELSFSTYGFRLGYRQTAVTNMPLKDKVAAIAAGGSNLVNKVACWGDSLTLYQQDQANSYPAQLAALLGNIPYLNGGISGQTMPQIKTRFDAAPDKYGWISIFEAYNAAFTAPDADMAALDAMVEKLSPANSRRWLILACLNGDIAPVGTPTYNQIAAINERRRIKYPFNFVDVRRHLIINGLAEAGILPTSGDLTDIANDVPPRSLRLSGDYLHLNAAGYGVVARQIANIIRSNHWLSS